MFVDGGAVWEKISGSGGGSPNMELDCVGETGIVCWNGSRVHISESSGGVADWVFSRLAAHPCGGNCSAVGVVGVSVEFNFIMGLFGWESQVPPQELRAWILSPQLVAIYTFLEEPVRPFAGLGLGVNVNFARYGREVFDDELGLKEMTTSSVEIPVSLAVVLKGGVRVAIPRSGFDLLAFLRYNLNFVGNVWLDNELLLAAMNCSTFSFGLGAAYRF